MKHTEKNMSQVYIAWLIIVYEFCSYYFSVQNDKRSELNLFQCCEI